MTAAIMAPKETVSIIVAGGAARIEPVDQVAHIVRAEAFFQRRVMHPGGRRQRRLVDFEPVRLYKLMTDPSTGGEYYFVYAGLVPRIAKRMRREGMQIDMTAIDTGLPRHPPDFTWARRNNIKLRDGQMQMLRAVLQYERAQLVVPPAGGKSYLIRVLTHCYPYPDCRIVIAVPSLNLLHAYLRELRLDFPLGEVGQVGGGRRETGARIVVASFASLELVEAEKTNLLFVDEAHECGTENRTTVLSRFVRSRVYGFTASARCRSDAADLAVEAIFGPPMTEVSYRDAVAEGYVPEVDVYFYKCQATPPGSLNDITRKRIMVWRNRMRNETVAGVCRHWEKKLYEAEGVEPQILVLVDKIEHMFYLHQCLPDYELIYDSMTDKLRRQLVTAGVIDPGHRCPTEARRLELVRLLMEGVLRKAIAQTIVGVGTDTAHLDVLVRADAKSSEVGNIQYRGRAMRGSRGIYADIYDYGDQGLESAARSRYRSARKCGMNPKLVDLWNGHVIVANPEVR